ncbi:MAG: ATP-dependent 6-phosphofructokinase [Actinobacteria bacterium]|nr:ATP-dependent 6-phosphofructokinase [Actinomycetota bacterium]MCL6104608.1 ATP-dependent 6-phosphofructokinase [Actinomycetota bacterium]
MRIGVLTGGGDCPGLNAVIRAIVCSAAGGSNIGGSNRVENADVETSGNLDEVIGFLDGWRGLLWNQTTPLTLDKTAKILTLGGTILGTSRTNPFAVEGGVDKLLETVSDNRLDAVIAIGGDDTLGVAHRLAVEASLKVVGVPKTIDNDLSATDLTFGFDTAVQIATDAIDRLCTTAESHHRIIVCEVMGRNTGWIATYAGIAGGAAMILIPEEPFNIEDVCKFIEKRHSSGYWSSVIVVAEGAKFAGDSSVSSSSKVDAFGHEILGGVGTVLAEEIQKRTELETRVTILGHIQRGGTPTAFDRVLATRFGVAATMAVHDGDFDTMVGLVANEIVRVPLADAVGVSKKVDLKLFHDVAEVFFK